MKLIITAIVLGLVFNGLSQEKEAKKEIAVSTEKSLKVKDLPAKVQASIKKVCKGEISTIQAVKAEKTMNYKVTCKAEKKNTIYFFDAEGNTIK